MNRQYIGARYVPKFAEPVEWDKLRSYEGLTVVTYAGTSYTSKKPVPAGVELNNTEYWVVTGNYNEQVQKYREEVEKYTKQITSKTNYTATVSTLKEGNYSINDTVQTNGYYSNNDGGSAIYVITDTIPSSYYEELNNGLYAELIIPPIGAPEMFGAYGDNNHDDSKALSNAIKYCGKIMCNKVYRIKNNVVLRDDVTTEEISRKQTTITGKGKNVRIVDTGSNVNLFSETEATFVFDGGSFTLNGTSYIDFNDCVFMGSLNTSKSETAFNLTPPARKLNIVNSSFVNLDNGIKCNSGEPWSGESNYNKLYFSHCKNGIFYTSSGADIEISECIFQGTCDYSVILKSATGVLFTLNHDYSSLGCEFWYGANLVGNYFDGLGKLKIATNYEVGTSTTNKGVTHGMVISGNTFFTKFHNQEVRDYVALVTPLTDRLVSTVICDNKLDGGYDNANVVVVDLTNVKVAGDNTIANNSGAIDALFKGSTNNNNNYYYNNYSGYKPVINYPEELIPSIQIIDGVDGCIINFSVKNVTSETFKPITVSNVCGGSVECVTTRISTTDEITISADASLTGYVAKCKLQITTFYIQYGTKALMPTLFTV